MNTLSRLFLTLIVSLLLAPGAAAQCELNQAEFDTARGTVYLDANNDGTFDRSERGVEGVRVSNGCEVVRTAVDGSYQIAITSNTILFISKPAG
ncbi:MAG TPA: metallophosphoesterase, partial [Gammaproteobacteria bacterium]|nr:metallophosphoesterase [Gammaproteobacteria bacterium]